MCRRAQEREAFGNPLVGHGALRAEIAQSRTDQARLLTMLGAHFME